MKFPTWTQQEAPWHSLPGESPSPKVSSREQLGDPSPKGNQWRRRCDDGDGGVLLESFGPKLQLLPGNRLNPGGGQRERTQFTKDWASWLLKRLSRFLPCLRGIIITVLRPSCTTLKATLWPYLKKQQKGIMGLHHCNPKKVQYIHTSRGLNYHW